MQAGARLATEWDWGNGPSPKEGCEAVSHGPGKAHTATQGTARPSSARVRAWPRSLDLQATAASTHLLLRMGLDPQHWPGRDWLSTVDSRADKNNDSPRLGPASPVRRPR